MSQLSDMIDAAQIERHLRILFDDACADHDLMFVIFALPSREPFFFRDPGSAVPKCVELAESGQNVYCAMGMLDREPEVKKSRGTASDVRAITHLWADVDVDGDGHAKKSYAKTVGEAIAVASVGEFPPSYFVHSGGGIHAYWPLSEPLVFDDDDDRRTAEVQVQRWSMSVKSRAAAVGVSVDSVHDISRVLRVAGTINWKIPDNPRPVVLMSESDRPTAYHLDDLEPYMVAPEYVYQEGRSRALGEVAYFDLNPDAEIDPRILEALMANQADFADTWRKARSDFEDQSGSTYDFSLANFFVRAGWTDQQIVDALIHWRRLHGEPEKLRVDYYQRTIGKIRATVDRGEAVRMLVSEQSELPEIGDPEKATKSDRERHMNALRGAFGIELSRIIQVNRDDSEFLFELEDGTKFSVGDIGTLTEFRLFRRRIAEVTGIWISMEFPGMGSGWKAQTEAWDYVVRSMMAVRSREDSDEATHEQRCRGLVVAYLDSARVYSEEQWNDALRDTEPFVKGNRIHIHATTFANWCRSNMGVRVDRVTRDFKLLGMETVRVQGRLRGGRKNRSYWVDEVSNWPTIPDLFGSSRAAPPGEDES